MNLERGIQMELPLILICAAFAAGFLFEISLLLRELIRTMRRIEARLTLLKPLESEAKSIRDDLHLRVTIEERATQPDIWSHKTVEELRGLKGEEYRDLRKIQRFTEKTNRN